MSWSKCLIEIGKTGTDDAFPETLKSVGTIKDKSTTLETSDGDTLEAKATGGILVAKETQEGGYTLTTRIIEPEDSLFVDLGLGEVTASDLDVKTHIVSEDYAVKVTPKNIGAKGIKAAKASVSFKPGYSEEEGHFVDLTFDILMPSTGVWYTRFTKTA